MLSRTSSSSSCARLPRPHLLPRFIIEASTSAAAPAAAGPVGSRSSRSSSSSSSRRNNSSKQIMSRQNYSRSVARAKLRQYMKWRQQEEEEEEEEKEEGEREERDGQEEGRQEEAVLIDATTAALVPAPPPPEASSIPMIEQQHRMKKEMHNTTIVPLQAQQVDNEGEEEDEDDDDDGLMPTYDDHQEDRCSTTHELVSPREEEKEETTTTTITSTIVPLHSNPPSLIFKLLCSLRREVHDILLDVFRKHFPEEWQQWQQEEEEEGKEGGGQAARGARRQHPWHLLWTWSKPHIDYTSLVPGLQRVNHIPNSRHLTRKDLLLRHLHRYMALINRRAGTTTTATTLQRRRRQQGTSSTKQQQQDQDQHQHQDKQQSRKSYFHIMPQTFSLPQAYTEFLAAFTDGCGRTSSSVWILKPVESSRGRGIKLINDLTELTYSEPVVIQRYITNPFLLAGKYKWDLRLYVLVTSFQPLEAFVYREGYARLCLEPFDMRDLQNPLIHLTNSSIQTQKKKGPPADHPLWKMDSAHSGGSKVRLSYLWRWLAAADSNIDSARLWTEILTLILKSLVCVEDTIPAEPCAFELFGYDILLDSDLRPWLLEVNASPSLAREYPLDAEVKEQLLADTIRLVYNHNHKGENQQEGTQALGGYERLCPGTQIYSEVRSYKRRYVRDTRQGK